MYGTPRHYIAATCALTRGVCLPAGRGAGGGARCDRPPARARARSPRTPRTRPHAHARARTHARAGARDARRALGRRARAVRAHPADRPVAPASRPSERSCWRFESRVHVRCSVCSRREERGVSRPTTNDWATEWFEFKKKLWVEAMV